MNLKAFSLIVGMALMTPQSQACQTEYQVTNTEGKETNLKLEFAAIESVTINDVLNTCSKVNQGLQEILDEGFVTSRTFLKVYVTSKVSDHGPVYRTDRGTTWENPSNIVMHKGASIENFILSITKNQ